MKKGTFAKRAIACVCSGVLACALVPATAMTALADATIGGSADVMTLVSGTAADTTQYSLDGATGGSKFGGSASKKRADITVNKDAAITPDALKAVASDNTTSATAGWFGIQGHATGATEWSWEWAFNSKNYTAADVTATANMDLGVTATASDNQTTTVTIDADLAFPTETTLTFPAATDDGNFLLLKGADGKEYTGAVATDTNFGSNAKSCSVFGLTKGGTYTVEQTAFVVYGRDASTGENKLLKSFTEEELTDATRTYPTVNYYVGSPGVIATSKYAPINALLKGIDQWKAGSYIEFTCNDGVYSMMQPTYETLHSGKNMFYPNYALGSDGTPTYGEKDAVAVDASIVFEYKAATIANGQSALDVVKTLSGETSDSCPRYFQGVPESQYTDTTSDSRTLAGNSSPSGITYMTIVYPGDISKATVTTSSKVWNGKAQAVKPTVKLGGKTLVMGTDYTISRSAVTSAGAYTITVKGMGDYTGTKTFTQKVNMKKAAPKLTVGKGKITVTFAATGASKYKISYRAKGTSKWKSITTTTRNKAITKLTKGKTYQVQIQSQHTGVSSVNSSIVTSGKVK